MLIGGHVSPAGGLAKAYARGVAIGADAIQFFHQNPRAWRPTRHREDDLQRFRELMREGPVRAAAIHAVYLINCASSDREIRRRSIESLVHAVRLGDAIGAVGVVLHPGSSVGGARRPAMRRAGQAFRTALAESDSCPLLLENTAGAGSTLGRSFEELAELIELGGGDERLGLCLDCCHLIASGFEIRGAAELGRVVDACVGIVGLERLRCLHVNDSQAPLGANRDRHADLPLGELGRKGLSAFLSEPRFEGLPALLEVPGPAGRGPDAEQIAIARRLRASGLRSRRRARG